MTPEQREEQRAKNAAKNERRKAAKADASSKGRRIEAKQLRRAYGGAFANEKFSEEGGLGDLIGYGTAKGSK